MTHRSRLAHFVIDVADLDQGTAFWSAALDAVEEPLNPDSSTVYRRLRLPDAPIRVLLQLTSDPKTHKERMHLDLETDEFRAKPSTGENIVRALWPKMNAQLSDRLVRLRLWETPNNRFTLRREFVRPC